MTRYRSLRFWRVYPGDPTGVADRIEYVCSNLRPFDEEEALAIMGAAAPSAIAKYFRSAGGTALEFSVISIDWNEPIAIVAINPSWSGIAAAQMVATERFPEISMDLARYVRRWLIPRLLREGVRRVTAHAMEAAADNCRYLEVLGATREGLCKMLGKDGQTYVQYAWTKGDGLCA